MRRRRVTPDERGTASVELVAYLPVVVLAAIAATQLYVAAWTATSTTVAARAAARADSLGRDPQSAAVMALPRSLRDDLEEVAPVGGGWRVKVRIPLLLTGLSSEDLIVRRLAAFPPEVSQP